MKDSMTLLALNQQGASESSLFWRENKMLYVFRSCIVHLEQNHGTHYASLPLKSGRNLHIQQGVDAQQLALLSNMSSK